MLCLIQLLIPLNLLFLTILISVNRRVNTSELSYHKIILNTLILSVLEKYSLVILKFPNSL